MIIFKKIFNFLVTWGDTIYEARKSQGINRMY